MFLYFIFINYGIIYNIIYGKCYINLYRIIFTMFNIDNTMVKSKRQKQEDLAIKLLNTFPNCIVEDSGIIDIEETVDELSNVIMSKFDEKKQKHYFGEVFSSPEECYRWLLYELPDLQEICYEIISG